MDLLVFPHQLFEQHPGLQSGLERVLLIEDSLFFGDPHYVGSFHKQKLWLHRSSLKRYEAALQAKGHSTHYIDYNPQAPLLGAQLDRAFRSIGKPEDSELHAVDPTDFMAEKRLKRACREIGLELKLLSNPNFINTPQQNREFRDGKKRWFMADFYRFQRTRLDILMEGDEPEGGKWSFDDENRKKVPKKLLCDLPKMLQLEYDAIDTESRDYVESNFADNPGQLSRLHYPTSHAAASRWLSHFLEHRFADFGAYEDAIVQNESWLWHGVLTPALNIGLLSPQEIVDETLAYATQHSVCINSVEGFIRQLIGWREFVRATYEDLGVAMRTSNHWEHHRAMPASLYDGTTGILPIDDTIRRILDTGYCHHIERLMVLGGFMFLCEIEPKQIYRWFMEMFVDSYDWVMVPNVYGMSQHADGGSITTKPYFSGSAYVRKMSNYPAGDWCDVWDGLYWRWIWNHVDELATNPRWAMMCSMAKKMDEQKRAKHLQIAEKFLKKL